MEFWGLVDRGERVGDRDRLLIRAEYHITTGTHSCGHHVDDTVGDEHLGHFRVETLGYCAACAKWDSYTRAKGEGAQDAPGVIVQVVDRRLTEG